jgi:hypothetical protein
MRVLSDNESLTVVTFEVEHIHPLSLGDLTEFENLCLACLACNRHKANRIVGRTDDGAESRLFHPQNDHWLNHLDWSMNDTMIVGLTDVGKATIHLLRMNRPQLVEVRLLWTILANTHPGEFHTAIVQNPVSVLRGKTDTTRLVLAIHCLHSKQCL